MCNELDSGKFDPLLVRSAARNVARAMELFVGRVDALVRLSFDKSGSIMIYAKTDCIRLFCDVLDRAISNTFTTPKC